MHGQRTQHIYAHFPGHKARHWVHNHQGCPWVGEHTLFSADLPAGLQHQDAAHRTPRATCTSDTAADAGVWADALKVIRCLSGIQTYWVPRSFTFLLTCFQKEAEKGNRCFVRLPVTHRVPARGTDPGDPAQLVPCDPVPSF